ncbi:MAG: GNAT family N-acetyltransferase [Thermoleophilia bacterium]
MPIEPDDALSWARRVRQYRTLLEAGEGFILVAHDGAVPRGYATVEIRDPDDTYGFGGRYAEVVTLGVSEAVRGRGIGSRLLDHVDAELSRRGVHAQIISVMVGNDGARRLYERRGFRAGEVSLYRPGRMP